MDSDNAQSPLPCPFCGKKPKMSARGFGKGQKWRIECEDEKCHNYVSSPYPNRETAIWSWNRRAPEPESSDTTKPKARHSPKSVSGSAVGRVPTEEDLGNSRRR